MEPAIIQNPSRQTPPPFSPTYTDFLPPTFLFTNPDQKFDVGEIGGSNFYQKIFFSWTSPLISLGRETELTESALPSLPQNKQPKLDFDRCSSIMKETSESKKPGRKLLRVLRKTFSREIKFCLIFELLYAVFTMALPVLTQRIVEYAGKAERDITQGAILFSFLVAASCGRILFEAHRNYREELLGFNLNNILCLQISAKCLKYPFLNGDFQLSDVINYTQIDADRFLRFGLTLGAFVSVPIMIITGLVMLGMYIGLATLPALGVILGLNFVSVFLSKKVGDSNDEVLDWKDRRMELTSEMLREIKFIKVNTQEKWWYSAIDTQRAGELKQYRKKGFLDALLTTVYFLTSSLTLFFAIFTYLCLGNQVQPDKIFAVFTIFAILELPIYSLSVALSNCLEVYTSAQRIEKFLFAPEMSETVRSRAEDSHAVTIKLATLDRKKSKVVQNINIPTESERPISTFELQISAKGVCPQILKQNIQIQKLLNIDFKKGKLTMVIGESGSGKSSLLLAILGQLRAGQNSKVEICGGGSIAYSSQKPCILKGTIRENILFSRPYVQEKFQETVRLAALSDDLSKFTSKESTELHDHGDILSGGQKARIGLARALYSSASIFLLDDVLSAVDVTTSKLLMQGTIKNHLAGKTVIFCTHAICYADQADEIIIMKEGKVVRQGTYAEVQSTQEFKEVCCQENKSQESKPEQKTAQSDAKNEQALKESADVKVEQEEEHENRLFIDDPERAGLRQMREYIELNGGWPFVLITITSIFVWICCTTYAYILIEKWTSSPQDGDIDFYISGTLSVGSNIFMFIFLYTLMRGGFKQGKQAHRKLIRSLLYAPITSFYQKVTSGNIISRLSKDLMELDEAVFQTLAEIVAWTFIFLQNIFFCIFGSTYYVFVPICIVAALCCWLQRYYMSTQEQLTRLRKTTNAQSVNGLTSLIEGVATIRAYGVGQSFLEKQFERGAVNKQTLMAKTAVENWFSQRISFLSLIISMSAIGYAIFSGVDASKAGLLITFTLSLCSNLTYILSSQALLEMKLVSLQRLYVLMRVAPEEGYKSYLQSWKAEEECKQQTEIIVDGAIEFQNVSVRYGEQFYALRNINFAVPSGMKIGLVGETGAGKSTLINSLMRFAEVNEGKILIDNICIKTHFLKDLRRAFTFIEQNPTLVTGSLRFNLETESRHTDEELTLALSECNLTDLVKSNNGLDGLISNDSVSPGQKQLICICRALLKRSKIVLIDEATASVDVRNAEMIQSLMSTKFKDCTVITIAHRLSSLKSCDRILVLGKGAIIQWGTPEELLAKPNGVYAGMTSNNSDHYLA